MRKKLLISLGVLAALILVFVIVVALQPADFRVSRGATMSAPAAAIFPHVNDLKKWETWSPWAGLDPDAKYAFQGPAAGQGAAMTWDGNSQVGAGKLAIIESRPNELVRYRLDFYKPMAGTSEAEFSFAPEGGQTRVTWTMTGKNNFIAKAMCLFMDLDQMVGGQFEKGLASLRAIAEAASKP
jgi:hypothetical protein